MTETIETPQPTPEPRARDANGRFAAPEAKAEDPAPKPDEVREKARAIFDGIQSKNAPPVEAPADEADAGEAVEEPVEPKLSKKERDKLVRVLELTDADIESMPAELVRKIAARSAAVRDQLDDLHRQNQELSKERTGKRETESTGPKPPVDDPVLSAADLDPLREFVGPELVNKLLAAIEAPQRELARIREEQSQRQALSEAESAVSLAAQNLAGELPALGKSGALDSLKPTIAALAQTGEYESVEDVLRAAYTLKFGVADAKKREAEDRTKRRLDNQTHEVAPTKPAAETRSQKEMARELYSRLEKGIPVREAMRGAGIGLHT